MSWRHAFVLVIAAALTTLCVAAPPSADRKAPSKKGGSLARGKAKTEEEPAESAESGQQGTPQPATGQIVIRRQPLHLRGPEKYQISMHLEPKQLVRIASPFDGTVKTLLRKSGQKVDNATELVRMDVTAKQLVLERAKALHRAAELEAEQAMAKGGADSPNSTPRQLAEARLQAAKADLDLAGYWVEQGTLRAPFSGEVFGVLVSEGQVVRMGEPLLVLGDTSALTVEVPVDRAATQVGQNLSVKVEDQVASAKVDALLPLSARFEPLRDLLPSAALASVTIKNSEGTFRAGQTVYSPLIPRDPIADVPNSCIGNVGDGSHKVQVLRDNTVRDVVIATLAPIGVDRTFVSGPFREGDEAIESASQELVDGVVVRSAPMTLLKPTAKANGDKHAPSNGDKPAPEKQTGGI